MRACMSAPEMRTPGGNRAFADTQDDATILPLPVAPVSALRLVGFVTGDITGSGTGDETPGTKGGRPRKYATQAERQAAYRDRNAVRDARFDPAMWAWLLSVAKAQDVSVANVIHAVLKAGKCARQDWLEAPLGFLPLSGGPPKGKP